MATKTLDGPFRMFPLEGVLGGSTTDVVVAGALFELVAVGILEPPGPADGVTAGPDEILDLG
jgi:hypothetical protein